MGALIVKYIKSDFEKEVCTWFKKNHCTVLGFDQITKGKTGFSKRVTYIKAALILKNQNYNPIIVFDDYDFFIACKIIGINNIYLWMWNTITNKKSEQIKLRISKTLGRVYSFDQGDCKKYNIRYNTQFYSFPDTQNTKSGDAVYDIFFIGKDKGRYDLIYRLANYLDESGITYSFKVFSDSEKKFERKDLITTDYLNYHDICRLICQSNAVLDIVQDGQEGLTLRAMEALFYDKKIVTNNTHYIDLPFYSSESIYFLEDGLEGLKDFIEAPEVKYDETIKDYYSIENWLRRFQ